MKKLAAIVLSTSFFILCSDAIAQIAPQQPVQLVEPYPRLNTVSYQLAMEQWVNTQTALVTVSIAANVGQSGLADLQKSMNERLNQLGSGVSWHMIQFNRSEDQSGLEQVNATAQARILQSQLAEIREKAKTISKPGIKYVISDISYEPSVADVQTVKEQLRNQMYQKIEQEIQLLSKTYHQTFYVNDIQFEPTDNNPVAPMALMRAKAETKDTADSANSGVSQKVVLQATVTLASTMAAG
jgi:hypothetical protein